MSPGWIACARPTAPSTAGTPERPQHDRGVALRAAFLGRHAGEPRRIEQRRIRRPQRLADQHRALRQAGETAERRAGQVAHQPPADLAHLLGAARQAGAVLRRHAGFGLRQDRRGDRLGLFHHGAFGRQQAFPRSAAARRGSAATARACGCRRRSAAQSPPGFPPAARPADRAAWSAACATARWRRPAGRLRAALSAAWILCRVISGVGSTRGTPARSRHRPRPECR